MATALPTETAALYDLRRTRKRRRLGDIEWFDSAYRVYLAALFGGGGVLWVSSAIGSDQVSTATARSIAAHGPAWLGVVAAVAVMIGARSGAQGGPLALEAADVSMVMLAPVERGVALRRPAVQRLRSALGLGVLAGAVAGQLAGRRLPGSAPAWAAGGALFGLTVGLAWFGAALVAHAIRAKLAVTTTVGLAMLGWQVAAAAYDVPGPYTVVGSLGLWGWRQHPVDLVAVVVAAGLTIAGLAGVGRTSLEALARRSSLVAQLRFAVTMQDLRTVVLLRRQLNQEHSRTRPWVRFRRSGRGDPVIRRGLRGLARTPLTRFVRIAAIAAVLGAAVAGAGRGAGPAGGRRPRRVPARPGNDGATVPGDRPAELHRQLPGGPEPRCWSVTSSHPWSCWSRRRPSPRPRHSPCCAGPTWSRRWPSWRYPLRWPARAAAWSASSVTPRIR